MSTNAHTRTLYALTIAALFAAIPVAGVAQEHTHEDGDDHTHAHGLHFTHPLITESVSPDTKVRFDFVSTSLRDGDRIGEIALEAEYAFHPSFSIEVKLPYQTTGTSFGETHLGFKFANYAFEHRGLLLGYGLDFGLPTGEHAVGGHGHEEEHAEEEPGHHDEAELDEDIVEFEPFFNVGWQAGRWEIVSFMVLGIPTNQPEGAEARTEISLDASFLYKATDRLITLVEYNGTTGLSGHNAGAGFATITPGVKVRPIADSNLELALGLSLPLQDHAPFDRVWTASMFWHVH